MNTDIKLIALDLDGTLYQRDGQIGDFTKQQIRLAIQQGIAVVISTGRPYVGLPLDDAVDLGIRYAITSNGAAIYEIPSRKCLYEEGIPAEVAVTILKSVYQYHLHLDAFIQGSAYTQASTREIIRRLDLPESIKNYILTTRDVVPDLCQYITERKHALQKVTLNFESESDGTRIDRNEVKQLLESYPQIKIVCGGFMNLEFTKAGVSKASGLDFLCRELGISTEAAMACGDSENDLDIMQKAGLAVAMDNASPEIKSIAHYVTASCNADGVGLAIQKFALTPSV